MKSERLSAHMLTAIHSTTEATLNYQPLPTALNTSCFSVNDWIKALNPQTALPIHILLESQLKHDGTSIEPDKDQTK